MSGIGLYLHCTSLFSRGITYLFISIRSWCRLFDSSVNERQKTNIDSRALKERFWLVVIVGLYRGFSLLAHRSRDGVNRASFNLFTTIHDENFRRHSSMNVTIKWHKFSSNIYCIYVFFVIWSWKLRFQMTKNRTPTPVYLDPGMHPGLEVKGLMICAYAFVRWDFNFHTRGFSCDRDVMYTLSV